MGIGTGERRHALVLGYIGGTCAVLSSAYFPYYLFAVYGVVVGVWSLFAKSSPVTAPRPEAVGAI